MAARVSELEEPVHAAGCHTEGLDPRYRGLGQIDVVPGAPEVGMQGPLDERRVGMCCHGFLLCWQGVQDAGYQNDRSVGEQQKKDRPRDDPLMNTLWAGAEWRDVPE